jgi:hypothetical protein
MVDNNQPMTEEEILASVTDESARADGYPSKEVYLLQRKMVKLGWKLNLGDKRVRDEYLATLNEALAKGWTPYMLDGQQEAMVGEELNIEMYNKYEA